MKIPFTDLQISPVGEKQLNSEDQYVTSQTKESMDANYMTEFGSYNPLKHNMGLYELIRELIPFIDIAITKLSRLIGSFEIITDDENLKKDIDDFRTNVKVNWFERGLDKYIMELVDATLTKGVGWGEIIPTESLDNIYRLKMAESKNLRFIFKDGKMLLAEKSQDSLHPKILPNQDLLTYVSFNTREGHPQGYSLLYSLPFVAENFIKLHNVIRNLSDRIGDPIFVVWVEGAANEKGMTSAKNIASGLATEVQKAMKEKKVGKSRDIFAATPNGGKIHIDVVGADGSKLMNIEFPMRSTQEQLMAATHLPPFVFGAYNWNSNYKMSQDQVDMLISQINSYRESLNPIIEKIIDSFLIYTGKYGSKWKFEWNPVNIMDEVELSRAKLNFATASAKEVETLLKLYEFNMLSDDEVIDRLIGLGYGTKLSKQELKDKIQSMNYIQRSQGGAIRDLVRSLKNAE